MRFLRILFIVGLLTICSVETFSQTTNNNNFLQVENGKVVNFRKGSNNIYQPTPKAKTTQAKKYSKQNAPITLNILTTGANCQRRSGSIIVQASGGVPPYTYQIENGSIQANGNFQNISEGSYQMTVRDAAGESAVGTAVVTNTFSAPLLTASSYVPASGCATNDASVTLQASGGVPPYTYSIDGSTYQTSNVFTDLYAGTYEFIVKDANGCTNTFLAFNLFNLISPACNVSFGLSHSLYACGPNGNIDFHMIGNEAYTYSLDGIVYQTSPIFSNLLPGVYVVYAMSASGNLVTFAAPIFSDCKIAIDFISISAACTVNDGQLTVNASLGLAPYTYSMDGLNYQSSNVFTGLAPGIYQINVKDAFGNIDTEVASVYDRCPEIGAQSTDETCSGPGNGTITATATNGTAPYQYSLDGVNFQAGNVFTGLTQGTYQVTLKDALGFEATTTVVVNYNCLQVFTIPANSTCGNNNGSIQVSVTNGTSPYFYSLDGINFQPGNSFGNLSAGSYSLTVKDANGLSVIIPVVVLNTDGATLSLIAKAAGCAGNDGEIIATGSGGTSPYFYSMDGITYQSSNTFSNLTPGSYSISIRDALNCVNSISTNITTSCPQLTTTVNNETCSQGNGNVMAVGSSGTAPYQYSIDGINFQSAGLFPDLSAGSYSVIIRDAAGITNSGTAVVTNICPIVTAISSDGICTTAGGVITATGNNGYIPYQYSINGVDFQSSGTFRDLSSGSYTITVKDDMGLTNTTTVSVMNFPSPALSTSSVAASCLNNDGSITLIPSGGVAPFSYSIDGLNFQGQPVFERLRAGYYEVVVKDVNGCEAVQPAHVPSEDNLLLSTGDAVTICEGEKLKLPAISNGQSFTWQSPTALNFSNLLNPEVSPLISTYYLISTELGICRKSASILINVNPAPMADAGQDAIICFGKNVMLTGNGGSGYIWTPSTYLSNNSSSSPTVIRPQASITYSLTVTDPLGCKSLNNEQVTVTVTPPAKLFAGNDTSIIIGEPFQLMALDQNSSGFVTFNWTPALGLNNPYIFNPVATLSHDQLYTVTAETAAGCEGTDQVLLKVYKGPDIYMPSAFTPNNDGLNDLIKPVLVGIKELKYFKIFNRWGEQVFYTTNETRGWDGVYKNTVQRTDTYVWMAEGLDVAGNRIFRKGVITLVR